MDKGTRVFFLFIVTVLCSLMGCEAIRCYECSSDGDPKGHDLCGAYKKFDKEKTTLVGCNSLDSSAPGTFCVKTTKQSPVGFIGNGRWRQVIRRCASVSDTGVTGVCNWGVEENGDYWEECSCSEDGCNGASSLYKTSTIFLIVIGVSYTIFGRT